MAIRRKKDELADAVRDLRWWQSLMPPGWEISGWTYRRAAQAISPNGRAVQLDGEFMTALAAATNAPLSSGAAARPEQVGASGTDDTPNPSPLAAPRG